jgi:integrase
MSLTDIKVKSLKPCPTKNYKEPDEKGLYLLIRKDGSKYWRFKYRFCKKEKLLALGVYPEISLANARIQRDEAREQIRKGIDPSVNKKAIAIARQESAENSFEVMANEWLMVHQKSEASDIRIRNLLKRDLFPSLGHRPIKEISPPELLQVLRRIEARTQDTARKARQYAGQIFRYAIQTGRAERDPSADLKGALKAHISGHFAAITDPKELGKLMTDIKNYSRGTPVVKAALELSALFFCRPGELRRMEWSEVNWEEKRIELPAAKMKMKQSHIIPLCTQALNILSELHLLTGYGRYIFPNSKTMTRPLSENGVRAALRTLGYDNNTMTGHGFRATARTLLDEVLGFRTEWIEHQLAHTVRDANGTAYNRTKHLEQRRTMMQKWADYLDALCKSSTNAKI